MKLSNSQIEFFWNDGYLVVEELLGEEGATTLRRRADWVVSGQAKHISKTQLLVEPEIEDGQKTADTYAVGSMKHLAFGDEVFEAHARNPKILDIIESLLGSDLKLYQDAMFMKPPKVGSRQRHHQDRYRISPPDMVTCWAALDDATVENGCLWMLPGTHKFGILEPERWAEYEKMSLQGNLPEERPVELKTGSCAFHHGLILHDSSQPNMTKQRRRGYATHYVSARCRYTGQSENNDAMLVRGREIPGCI